MTFFIIAKDSPKDSTKWIGPFMAKWEAHQYCDDNRLTETHTVVSRDQL